MRKAMRVAAIGAIAAMAVVILGLAYGAGAQSEARAQTGKGEVTLIAPGGARAAVEALIPGFEKKTGY
jgi:ABC-type glycerol-3-phosphate transport system substrate-binding protein